MKKILSGLIVFLFSINTSFAAVSVNGQIQSVELLEDGRFEIRVITEEGVSVSYIAHRETVVKQEIPATEVKKGKVLALGGGSAVGGIQGIQGVKGFKSPFENMSPAAKKNLGLPDIPSVPSVPSVPNVPETPQVPNVPQIPQLPAGLPNQPAEKQKPASEEEIPELPQDRSFSELNPKAVSPVTLGSASEGKKVISAKETREGIEVVLEGDEEIVFKPDQSVVQLLGVKDLREDMIVQLDVENPSEGAAVQQITII